MNYKSPEVVKMESVNLGELTPMELRCMESLEPLKPNDLVVVMYITRLGENCQIPLKIPYIIKSDKFQASIDRFVEMLAKENTPLSTVVLPNVVQPYTDPSMADQ